MMKGTNTKIEHSQLLRACDEGNLSAIESILSSTSFEEDPLKSSLRMLIDHNYLELIPVFLSRAKLLPQEFLDQIFFEQFSLGINPDLILLLQEYCSTKLLSEAFRRYQKHRQQSQSYLVNPIELEKYKKEILPLINPTKKRIRPLSSLEYLKKQFSVNNVFQDGCFCDNRYIVLKMLSLQELHQFYPSQLTVNAQLYYVLNHQNFILAELLCQERFNALCVTQQGINEAFHRCIQEHQPIQVLEWFLTNSCNIRPTEETISQAYFDLSVYDFHESRQSWRTSGKGEAWKRFFVSQMRKWQREMQQRGEERLSFLQMMKGYISDEAVFQRTQAEIQRLTRRQMFLDRGRRALGGGGGMFGGPGTDIHMYSSSAVQNAGDLLGEEGEVDEGLGEGGPMDIIDDLDDDDEDEDMNGNLIRRHPRAGAVPVPPPQPPQQQPDQPANENDPVPPAAAAAVPPRPPRQRIHQRRTINNVVRDYLRRKIENFYRDFTSNQVMEDLDHLIRTHLPIQQQENAIRRIGELLNNESVENFSITLQYLHHYHPQEIGIWIVGFLGESVEANSCTAGAMERIATGLRGINDAELNQIFGGAEGRQLFSMFLSNTLNIISPSANQQRNIENLVNELMNEENTIVVSNDSQMEQKEEETAPQNNNNNNSSNLSVSPFPTPEIIRKRLSDYLQQKKEEYNIPANDAIADAEGILEVIMDCYDDILLSRLQQRYDAIVAAFHEQQQQQSSSNQSEQQSQTNNNNNNSLSSNPSTTKV
jgi:hypothetical protein